MISYSMLNQQLANAGIGLTAAELQGFLSGLLCGGVNDQSWQPLLYQFTNDDHAYPTALLNQVAEIYQQLKQQFEDVENFSFELLLPDDDDVYQRADALSEWANHFLLALGLSQPQLDKQTGEIGEGIDDLQDICQLGYDEQDNKEELSEALEEVIEYVRTLATLFYTHFNPPQNAHSQADQPTLH